MANAIKALEKLVEDLVSVESNGVGAHKSRSVKALCKKSRAYLVDECGYSSGAAGQAIKDAKELAALQVASE